MKTFHVRRPARLRHAHRPALAFALAGAALALALGIAAPAHADKDADRARAAVQSGEILPLSRILEAVSQQYAGDVIGVELDRDDGVWQYEVKLLLPGGSVAKLEYDARTGALIKAKGRNLDQARKQP